MHLYRKKITYLIAVLMIVFLGYKFFSRPHGEVLGFSISAKSVSLTDNGLTFGVATSAESVSDFLKEKNITLGEHDEIIPAPEVRVFSGLKINIRRALKIKIAADGQSKEFYTLARNVGSAIPDSGLPLAEDDLIEPGLKAPLSNGTKIAITRVEIKEEILEKKIDFKTISEEDGKLGWRVKKVKQKGQPGTKEVKYKVVLHDGREISRKILEEKVAQDPVAEIVVQGTYVRIGKAHTGQGTWYAFKGGLFAASPWLPMGSYAKVTNKANGRSIIVQINDRGPFGPGRIIDLDKVAFAKIASLGAGVIDVKVEEILN